MWGGGGAPPLVPLFSPAFQGSACVFDTGGQNKGLEF